MALVAWAPSGYSVPMELLAVKIKPGQVTELQWWEALSDRVSDLAVVAGPEAVASAFSYLEMPAGPGEPEETGQYLVLGNWNLKTHLSLALMDESPFPATVGEPSEEAKEALEIDFQDWVEHLQSVMSASSMD